MSPASKKPPRPNFENVGRRVDQEIEELIRWFNDEAVPSMRQHSSRAVRKAAEKLSKFADYMDEGKKR